VIANEEVGRVAVDLSQGGECVFVLLELEEGDVVLP
jgi:hypothetical protein